MENVFQKFKHRIFYSGKMGLFWLAIQIFFFIIALGMVVFQDMSRGQVTVSETLLTVGIGVQSMPLFFPGVGFFSLVETLQWNSYSPGSDQVIFGLLFLAYYGIYSVIFFTKNTRSRLFIILNIIFAFLFLFNLIPSLYILYRWITTSSY